MHIHRTYTVDEVIIYTQFKKKSPSKRLYSEQFTSSGQAIRSSQYIVHCCHY